MLDKEWEIQAHASPVTLRNNAISSLNEFMVKVKQFCYRPGGAQRVPGS